MPKPSRSSRPRGRSRRVVSGAPPAAAVTVPDAVEAPADLPVAPARTATRRAAAGLSAAVSQRSFTDYTYVIGELKRIFVISAAIVVLMLVLWLFIR